VFEVTARGHSPGASWMFLDLPGGR
jgi:hypothetical protein